VILPAAGAGTPGVTSTSILLGGTAPLSAGLPAFSSVARGADAYFKYVNAQGGVNGRKLKYTYLDDAENPLQTVEAVKRLIQQDRVFALFNMFGTDQNLAARSFLNSAKVPQLFVASGASTWGRDYRKYPWSIGYLPSYTAEGIVYGKYIAKTRPKAKIAILYQADDYTKDLISGLKRGLAGKGRIVAQEAYDPATEDIRPQVVKLKASKADTFMIFATGRLAIQAFVHADRLAWKAQVFVNQVATAPNMMTLAAEGGANKRAEGAISIVFVKDPADPKWAKDPAIALYKRILKRYGPSSNPKDVFNVYGMAAAFTMVDALKQAGRNLSRRGIVKAATSLNEHNNPFLLPGIVVRTTPTNRFPIVKAQLQRWHKNHWVSFGGLVNARG
jgi:branched-chain amino acid transport system substrate-binding protein